NTSGARPFLPRGLICGSSDMGISPRCLRLVPRLGFCGFPWIAAVKVHANVAARACGATESNRAPGRPMAIVRGDDVRQQAPGEEERAVHVLPGSMLQTAVLGGLKQSILFVGGKRGDRHATTLSCFRIERAQATSPGLAHLRQPVVAVPITVS